MTPPVQFFGRTSHRLQNYRLGLPITMNERNRRFPVLSATWADPGLFLGLLAFALTVGMAVALPQLVPVPFSLQDAAVAGGLLGSPVLGVGIGYDSSMAESEARRLFGAGSALLLLAFVGQGAGTRLVLLMVAPLGFFLQGIYPGRQLSGWQSRE